MEKKEWEQTRKRCVSWMDRDMSVVTMRGRSQTSKKAVKESQYSTWSGDDWAVGIFGALE